MSTPRSPSEAKPPRMEALSRLPLFFALEGKRALVAGGGTGAAWKAELLSATGAAVDVYAELPSEEMLALAAEPPRGEIAIHCRAWRPEDFKDAAIAIGGCESDAEAARFAEAARASRVAVDVVDQAGLFEFGLCGVRY